MLYRKLDADGDMAFGSGTASFWRDQPEAVAQAVKTRLALYEGDWFLDNTEGTPWMTRVLGVGTAGLHDMAIRDRVLGTQGCTAIADFASQTDGPTRALSVQVTIDTAYAPGPIAVATIVRPPG